MGHGYFGTSAPLFLRNGELLGHSPIHNMATDGQLISKVVHNSPFLENNGEFRQ
jgi:hypothetical protein